MKRICILTVPRSGTNYLCGLLASFRGVRSHFDLFHGKASWKLDGREMSAVSKVSGIHYSSVRDSQLVQFAHESPNRYLKIIEQANTSRADCLSFKIFPNQLEKSVLKSQIMTHEETAFIILRRSLLDSYISARVAMHVGKYTHVNTSDVSVSISASDYVQWLGRTEEWYSFCQNTLSKLGRRFATLSYEDDIMLDPDSLLQRLSLLLRENGVPVGEIVETQSNFEKQDRRSDPAKKVSNWSEFVADLNSIGVMPRPELVA
jgi:Sulfotransferase family